MVVKSGLLIMDILLLVVTPSLFVFLCNVPFVWILFTWIFKFTVKIKDKWRINIYDFIFGFFSMVLGYALMTDFAVNSLG